jgi:DNA-binding CsgD family transcriptional regulator
VLRADDAGDENGRPWLLCLSGELERLVGELPVALELAREGQDAAEQSGQPLFRAIGLALESMVQAQLGEPEAAATAALRAREISTDRFVDLVAPAALAHVALAAGSPEDAVGELAPGIAFLHQEGIVEPGFARFVIDAVEALVELGRRDEGVALLDWYEENAERLERASALASSARCRGLLAAQAGELETALAAFVSALEWHRQVDVPLDRGRTLLALGATQRRMKRRREARTTLEEALAIFERIGAALWAQRARAELKRISGRAATPGALTPAEQRVAALVAEGRTNREVAAALFVSERTVEGHISRIFGKLGIRHRSEIASVLAPTQIQGSASSNTGGNPVSAESPAP